jgi:hypothetical protein
MGTRSSQIESLLSRESMKQGKIVLLLVALVACLFMFQELHAFQVRGLVKR